MELLGYYKYKTFSYEGLGTVVIFWFMYLFCFAILFITWPFKHCCGRKLRDFIFEILFFKGFVLLIVELYLEYFIYIYFHTFGTNFNDEQAFVYLASILMFVLVPLIYFRILASEPKILRRVQKMWG